MGLDFHHNETLCGPGRSYIGFGMFRHAIAAHEGVDLDSMSGYGGESTWDTITTPLKPLLNHSDCDGQLTPDECRQIAPRLREVVQAVWDPDDFDYQYGMELADAMECVAASDEPLEFC